MHLIDGKKIAQEIIDELQDEISGLPSQPCIAFIRVGDDPASVSYVKKKDETAQKIGMRTVLCLFPEDVARDVLLAQIDAYNADSSIHGILIQAPLPAHLDENEVFNRVSPEKDVDGLTTVNMGRLVQEDPRGFAACTPSGILELLSRCHIPVEGRHVVVLGRSLLVGKSAALLFMQKGKLGNATVSICHSKTQDLKNITRQADILIAAIGRPRFVTADMIKDQAVVIDVGINRIEDSKTRTGYRLVGDVDFDSVAPKTLSITPVPGGVGPMTVAMLMKNTVKAYRLANSIES
jgi:methylenetetrahydrofolate dehydrogenase (NADP+)/methenyltetrahydrofolate cyclohydrolase